MRCPDLLLSTPLGGGLYVCFSVVKISTMSFFLACLIFYLFSFPPPPGPTLLRSTVQLVVVMKHRNSFSFFVFLLCGRRWLVGSRSLSPKKQKEEKKRRGGEGGGRLLE